MLLIFYAILVGIIAGLGAIVFRLLIALFHNLMFYGLWSFDYNTLLHTPQSSWGIAIIAVPVFGALIVAYLVKNFAPEAKGHGVPEVIDAINYNHGIIHPKVAIIKSIASSISIGSGGSVGREGPIIQIGATFGSVMAQWLKLTLWQRNTLIAAGAGGGIAATFNTPMGGIIFAVEIMMVEIGTRTLVPVMVATATASYIGQLYFGATPSFIIPSLNLSLPTNLSLENYVVYALLGLVVGILAMIYTRSIYLFEDLFDRMPGNYYTRHMFGMVLVGVLMYFMLQQFGHYYIQGVGYATIQDILNGKINEIGLLFFLIFVKLIAVSLTLGSGASGGVFSPALFMGAALGAGLAMIANQIYPPLAADPISSAVIGMACMIGASTGAAITGVVMILEMTNEYRLLVPLIIAVSIAYTVRHALLMPNIYTLKLVRRGHSVPTSLQNHLYLMSGLLDVIKPYFIILDNNTTLKNLPINIVKKGSYPHVILCDKDEITALVSSSTLASALKTGKLETKLSSIGETHFSRVEDSMSVINVYSKLHYDNASIALVVKKANKKIGISDISGMLTWDDISKASNFPEKMAPNTIQ